MAQKNVIGTYLEGILDQQGYHVTLEESSGSFLDADQFNNGKKLHLLIITNTGLSPAYIQSIIPECKARHPGTKIMILSGYFPEEFLTDLNQKGIDRFLPLPFEEDVLIKEIARLLPV